MHVRRRHAWQAPILDVIRHVLLMQHPNDLDEVIIRKNANLSTSSMEYSSSHLLNRGNRSIVCYVGHFELVRKASGRCEIR